MSSEESFFDFGGDFQDAEDLLQEASSASEETGEGDTAAFLGIKPKVSSAPVSVEEAPVEVSEFENDMSFDSDLNSLDAEISSTLDEIEQSESKPEVLVEDSDDLFVDNVPAEDGVKLEDFDSDELLDLLNETDGVKEESETENENEVPVEDLIPIIDEVPVVEEVKGGKNENSSVKDDNIVPLVEETVVDDNIVPLVEETVPLVEEVIPVVEEVVNKPVEKPVIVEEKPVETVVPQETVVKNVEIITEQPSLEVLGRIVKILDVYAGFSEEEKHSVLLLLYAGSIDITARDKVVQKVLSFTDDERLTIQTLKDLKQLDSVERAFSLMDLPDELLGTVSELVYYISDVDKPRGLSKIDLSRDVVKHIEKLKPDIVGFIEKATEIVSI